MKLLLDPWRAFWSFVWWFKEELGISLGRLAPWVMAQMMGCRSYKRVK